MRQIKALFEHPLAHLVLVVAIILACEPTTTSSRGGASQTNQLSALERTHQNALSSLEESKSQMQKHVDIYNRARTSSSNPIVDGNLRKARAKIIEAAQQLRSLAQSGLDNQRVIDGVPKAQRDYQRYLADAEEVLRRYQSVP